MSVINVPGRFHSVETGNVVANSNEIFDVAKEKKQSTINQETDAELDNRYTKDETYTKVEVDSNINTEKERAEGEEADIKERLSTVEQLADISLDGGEAQIAINTDFVNPDSTKRAKIPTVGAVTDAVMTKVGYFTCDTAAATAAKTVSATGYVLTNGGSMKIKMTNANTADNATLNINSTGAKALYYSGERASANNSWEAGETVEVYYDGTNFYANNVAGGSGSGDGAFDISVAHSGATYDNLAAALGTNGANVPKRKGGMSVKFIQNIYATYSVVKTEGLDTEPTGTELQSASAVTDGVYIAAQLSDLNTAATLPATVGSSVTYYFAVTVDETTTYTKWVVTKATNDGSEYVQWRYMGTSIADADFVKVGDWQGVDNVPTKNSKNLVESGGVYNSIEQTKEPFVKVEYATVGAVRATPGTDSMVNACESHWAPLDYDAKINMVKVERSFAEDYTSNIGICKRTDNGIEVVAIYPFTATANETVFDVSNLNIIVPAGQYAILELHHVGDTFSTDENYHLTSIKNFVSFRIIRPLTIGKKSVAVSSGLMLSYSFDIECYIKEYESNGSCAEALDSVRHVVKKTYTENVAQASSVQATSNAVAYQLIGIKDTDVVISKMEFRKANFDAVVGRGIIVAVYIICNTSGTILTQGTIDIEADKYDCECNIFVPKGHIIFLQNMFIGKDSSNANVILYHCTSIAPGYGFYAFRLHTYNLSSPDVRCTVKESDSLENMLADYKKKSISYKDSTNVLLYGSSLTWNGYSGKTITWNERVNDMVDVNIINTGQSGTTMQGNITALINNRKLQFDSAVTPRDLKPAYIMFNNAANDQTYGQDLYNQLVVGYDAVKQIGAEMLVGSEEPTIKTAKSVEDVYRSFCRKYNVKHSLISQLWNKLFNAYAPYRGWLEVQCIHGGYRTGSAYIQHADLLGALPIKKSIKMFKVRENYKNGTPAIADLNYTDNLERLKFWRGLEPGIGMNVSPWRADCLNGEGIPTVPDGWVYPLVDTVTTSETSAMWRGADITFYKYALIEFICDTINVKKGVFSVVSNVQPTNLYIAVNNVFTELAFTYEDGKVTASIDRYECDIQYYDKIKIVVYYNGENFTLAKPMLTDYDGEEKPATVCTYKNKQSGNELNDSTSVATGWTMGGNASVKELPSNIANYPSLNNSKKHIEMPDDGDYATKTISLSSLCTKAAFRIAACLYPKICTTSRDESDYVTSAAPTIRHSDYNNGYLIVTVNDNIVNKVLLEPSWTDGYFEIDVNPDDTALNIKIERQCFVDNSYINHTRPVFIYDVSVQDIS